MVENTNTCMCGERPEVELNTDARPLVVLSDGECGCDYDEVELYTDHQPDILLFEEWADEHVDDIEAARQAAEEARAAVNTQSAVIIDKEDQLIRGQQTIREEQRLGIGSILSGIAAAKDYVLSSINAVKSYIDSKTADILSAIQSSQFQTFTEASDAEIDDIFDALNLPEEE